MDKEFLQKFISGVLAVLAFFLIRYINGLDSRITELERNILEIRLTQVHSKDIETFQDKEMNRLVEDLEKIEIVLEELENIIEED